MGSAAPARSLFPPNLSSRAKRSGVEGPLSFPLPIPSPPPFQAVGRAALRRAPFGEKPADRRVRPRLALRQQRMKLFPQFVGDLRPNARQQLQDPLERQFVVRVDGKLSIVRNVQLGRA